METELPLKTILINYLISVSLQNPDMNNFPKLFKEATNFYNALDVETLKSLVIDEERLERLTTHKWFKRDVELKYIGGWPFIGDLPHEWCYLSVVDIAKKIQENPQFESISIKTILSMNQNLDLILNNVYPTLLHGGEIRTEKAFQYLPFDSDDGSHRCIAAAVAGRENITSFVGFV